MEGYFREYNYHLIEILTEENKSNVGKANI